MGIKTKTISFLILLVSFVVTAQSISTEQELSNYLDGKEKIYEEISVEYGISTWNLYSGEGEIDLETPSEKFAELYSDEELNNLIKEWSEKAGTIEDPVLKRRVKIWEDILLAAAVDYDEEIAELAGTLEEILSDKDHPDRPSEEILQGQVLKLMKLRNSKAKELGFGNYGELILELSGIGKEWFDNFVKQLDEASAPLYKEMIEKIKSEKGSVSFADLMPHMRKYMAARYGGAEISKDSLVLVMKETLAGIGLDYDSMPVRFVDKEIPYGGNGLAIKIPTDFRIVVLPSAGISTRLHELGHGLQGVFTSIESPILKGYEWSLGSGGMPYFEGMAETCAKLAQHPLWLKKYTNMSETEIAETRQADKYTVAFGMRFMLNWFLPEVEIYKNLDEDPQEVYAGVYKRAFMLDEKPGRPFQLASTMIVAYPCYLHNYLLADIISWQVHEAFAENFGEDYVIHEEVGQFIIDNLLKNGELKDWQQRLLESTGKKLDVTGYLKSKGL